MNGANEAVASEQSGPGSSQASSEVESLKAELADMKEELEKERRAKAKPPSAALAPGGHSDNDLDAAQRAAAGGDSRALLRYLRLRRGG